ncbi:hypothetical protein [Chitinophaga solisilvae]|uniref:hypothetical protein n=1 Tax=Chitinophaga solisilvae TaxID=1233460 RepID=UPI00136D953F|nr:hypothetical protein [Chitinophaga solisilvae]
MENKTAAEAHIGIEPTFSLPKPNTDIVLYEGDFELCNNNLVYKLNGRIMQQWLPDIGLKFEGQTTQHIDIQHLNFGQLIVQKMNILTEVCITHTSVGFESGPTVIEGLIESTLAFGNLNDQVDSITFELPNLRNFEGEPIKRLITNKNRYQNGRIVFEDDDYIITIDKQDNYANKFKNLKKTKGFDLLYTGIIKPKLVNRVAFIELNKVLNAFAYFLQLINGRKCSPLLRKGLLQSREIAFNFSNFLTSPYKFVWCWASEQHTEGFSELWKNFYTLYKNEDDMECLTMALHWYVEANNNSGSVEGAIVLAQNGLELLCNWCYEKGLVTAQSDIKPFSNKLNNLLESFGIPIDIPAGYPHLIHFAETERDLISTGPVIFSFIRNAYVHADPAKRRRLRNYSPMVTFDGAQLGTWYIELIILKILGYNGKYFNRTVSMPVAAKSIDTVPWASSEN